MWKRCAIGQDGWLSKGSRLVHADHHSMEEVLLLLFVDIAAGYDVEDVADAVVGQSEYAVDASEYGPNSDFVNVRERQR